MHDFVQKSTTKLTADLREFLADKEGPRIDPVNPHITYTKSPDYLLNIIAAFHGGSGVRGIVAWLMEQIPPSTSVIDVGCVCGFTGLPLAMAGRLVTFHDFEGLGLQFIRWFAEKEGLPVTIAPYGETISPAHADTPHKWSIALDVIEHTGEHVGFLRWMKTLGGTVAFSHPHIRWHEPWQTKLDEHVDHEALRTIIEQRYEILHESNTAGRQFMVYR